MHITLLGKSLKPFTGWKKTHLLNFD